MQIPKTPACSCYPHGLAHSRRSFLRALAATAAASGLPLAGSALALQAQEAEESVPAFPEGGFPDGSTRLNFNENPLGPSPRALRAILESGLTEGHRYNYIDPLIEAVAGHHDIPSANVIVGCGSTEFLQFVPWALLDKGRNLVLPDPSYGFSAGVAESMGADVVRVPLQSAGLIDLPALKAAMGSDTRMVYIANPNNPTGASLPLEDVRSLARALPDEAVLFVDEAYHDFLPGRSAIELVRADMPVIVARTFSKAYGMAGLRLGYAIAPDRVMEKVKRVWWGDFGINAAALLAGPAAIRDQAHVARYVKLVDEGLVQLRGGLKKMGFRPWPHRAPFFMVDLGRTARSLRLALYRRKIYVQDGANWKMPNFLRVSVGLAEENEVFLKALREISA